MKRMKEYAAMRKSQLKEYIAQKSITPTLLIIRVGDNKASERYVRNKIKDCEEVGIAVIDAHLSEGISTIGLLDFIQENQYIYDGVIVQQPLPAHINQEVINKIIDPKRDVDGFHPMSKFKPATAKGIVDYLEWRNFDFESAKVTVIGRSDIVGKPLARMLTDKDCTVTLCHSKTLWEDIWNSVNNSDLTICAVGQPHFLDCSSLSIPVIDVGINFDREGKMCGDCFVWNGTERNVSPVPGGVGLLTRVALLENVVEAAYG
jgi:methylenetetrahydrofolate dehydrogenase (NADP+)/methenyltetrahydrofolate cyclohydrolase